ncbi:hypothetical protein [Chryseobacterium sp. MEBOG07]|uniref:hypothetical protein n=1 Tax=Chryseobacterium sp. MEBOG07 TaxID=2879939 RepID=UPI001F42A2CF|nr:hypothetical protein [Chryseobacterium sp. MEBOG07]UKB81269.1 hypothetical protein LF886_09840 [Chryseobacterium sp. MEBOG07]
MLDYKEIMRELFQRNYSSTGEEWQMKKMSTMYIQSLFSVLIPSETITEHDVFEMLQELGYHPVLETLYEPICIFEGNEDEGREPEYDQKEVGKVFKWLVFEK